jgi:hypothetical protein
MTSRQRTIEGERTTITITLSDDILGYGAECVSWIGRFFSGGSVSLDTMCSAIAFLLSEVLSEEDLWQAKRTDWDTPEQRDCLRMCRVFAEAVERGRSARDHDPHEDRRDDQE